MVVHPFLGGAWTAPGAQASPMEACDACGTHTANAAVEVVADGSGIHVVLCDPCVAKHVQSPEPAA